MSTAWLQRGATTALHAGPLRRLLPTADGDRPPSAAPGTGDDRKSEREGFDDASSLSPYPELSRCTPESRRHVPHTPLVPDRLLPSDRVPSPARSGAPSPPLPHDLVCGAAETVPADRRATLARGRERESPRALRGSTQPPVARPGASSLGLVGRVSGPRLSARSLPLPPPRLAWLAGPGLRSFADTARPGVWTSVPLTARVPGDGHHLCLKDG